MNYVVMGTFDESKAGHNEHYYAERYTFIDFRGGLLIDPTAQFGFQNTIITLSHDISGGSFTVPAVKRPVVIEHHAWITSNCVLYNCTIGHHSIIAVGAVVRNMTVPPYTIMEGNPARRIAVWSGSSWRKITYQEKEE